MNLSEKNFREMASMIDDAVVFRDGWPDFLLVSKRTGRAFAIELKVTGDTMKKHQREMHEMLSLLGIETVVVDWPSHHHQTENADAYRKIATRELANLINRDANNVELLSWAFERTVSHYRESQLPMVPITREKLIEIINSGETLSQILGAMPLPGLEEEVVAS